MCKQGYQTRQSRAILTALKQTGHATADELYEALRATGCPVGRTTVWRRLEKLVEDGLVQKFAGAPGEGACYQFVGDGRDCGSHFHLKCTACGRLIHLDCDCMRQIEEHVARTHGFRVDRFRTVFYGLCAACADAQREADR